MGCRCNFIIGIIHFCFSVMHSVRLHCRNLASLLTLYFWSAQPNGTSGVWLPCQESNTDHLARKGLWNCNGAQKYQRCWKNIKKEKLWFYINRRESITIIYIHLDILPVSIWPRKHQHIAIVPNSCEFNSFLACPPLSSYKKFCLIVFSKVGRDGGRRWESKLKVWDYL